jgi:hypothetical protein
MTAVPAYSADPQSPGNRVSGTSFDTGKTGANLKPMVYNGGTALGMTVSGGVVNPGPTPFSNGDVSGNIYRYIVWDACPSTLCSYGHQHLKRIVVVAKLNPSATGGTRVYQELQGQVGDPAATPTTNPGPGPGGGGPKPWTFWLTDTPCNNSARLAIAGDHLTHNTRGACSAGLKNGNTPGAPDLMLTGAPPYTEEQPIYDYATDVEPATNPTLDKGVQLRSGGACNVVSALDLPLVPDILDPTKYQKVHKWLSPAIPSGSGIVLSGTGNLDLWTRTIGNAVHAGKICVWLFYRTTNILGVPIDTPVTNLGAIPNVNYFTYSLNPWPYSGWTEIQIPLSFNVGLNLPTGTRLGLAISVDGTGTPGDGLQFMYDEPSFDSRLIVSTNSVLPF